MLHSHLHNHHQFLFTNLPISLTTHHFSSPSPLHKFQHNFHSISAINPSQEVFLPLLNKLTTAKVELSPIFDAIDDSSSNQVTISVVLSVAIAVFLFPTIQRRIKRAKQLVEKHNHSQKKDEKCLCTFNLTWLQGPNEGKLYAAGIGDIFIVQPMREHVPAMASFLQISRRRIESNSRQEMVAHCKKGTKTKTKMGFFERMEKMSGKQRARRSVLGSSSLEVCHDESMEDKELEEKRNVCMILIGNLDKELCPSTAVEFLHKHTHVSASIFIFPSLSFEINTRGAIMSHTEQDFQTLCDFLTDQNYIITSSTGRPWVVIEKQVGLKNMKASIGTLFPKFENTPQEGKNRTGNNLKIVHSGTQEFKIASAKRDLFIKFADQQERLHKNLAFMEGSTSEI